MTRPSAIALLLGAALAADAAPSYNEDVRPLLSANCFKCHGPDEAERKAKTRLGRPRAKPTSTSLSHASPPTDPDERMPPPESEQVANRRTGRYALSQWVEAGATIRGSIGHS